ncbi:hypothetical protein GGF46_005201 [Coemansia sp. RSA 552]|nr:hypothetical protein GGF46_005201 [Coemansia sp. RSA 552]
MGGGMPDLSSLAAMGGGGGGMPDLSSLAAMAGGGDAAADADDEESEKADASGSK